MKIFFRFFLFLSYSSHLVAQDITTFLDLYKSAKQKYDQTMNQLNQYKTSPEYQEYLRQLQLTQKAESVSFVFTQNETPQTPIATCPACKPALNLTEQMKDVIDVFIKRAGSDEAKYELKKLNALHYLAVQNLGQQNEPCSGDDLSDIIVKGKQYKPTELRLIGNYTVDVSDVTGMFLNKDKKDIYMFFALDGEGNTILIKLVDLDGVANITLYTLEKSEIAPTNDPVTATNTATPTVKTEVIVSNIGIWTELNRTGESLTINLVHVELEHTSDSSDEKTRLTTKVSNELAVVELNSSSTGQNNRITLSSNYGSLNLDQSTFISLDPNNSATLSLNEHISVPFVNPLSNISTNFSATFNIPSSQTQFASSVSFINTDFQKFNFAISQSLTETVTLGLGGSATKNDRTIYIQSRFVLP